MFTFSYGMMNDCWRATPLSRPTFTKLVNNIGSLLEESVKNVNFY